MAKDQQYNKAKSLLQKIKEKINLPQVRSIDEGIDWFINHPDNPKVLCVNGKSTMVACSINEVKEFYN